MQAIMIFYTLWQINIIASNQITHPTHKTKKMNNIEQFQEMVQTSQHPMSLGRLLLIFITHNHPSQKTCIVLRTPNWISIWPSHIHQCIKQPKYIELEQNESHTNQPYSFEIFITPIECLYKPYNIHTLVHHMHNGIRRWRGELSYKKHGLWAFIP
jgi:hypothetical protein